MNIKALPFSLMYLLIVACNQNSDENEDVVCTLSLEPGIIISVEDANTRQSIAGSSTAFLTDGTYQETVEPQNAAAVYLAGAFERAGTYTVRVHHDGYQDWSVSDVEVEQGKCHVVTDELAASLIPIQ
ncbi:MAG: hypothetical protein JWQ90_2660 [Hydrocarboniphaga sp.]|uniref:hypothetical protein n=1 Tax=Hydrocarboniphaga sp. TaxID=2033016 RepID=UPI002634FC6D|nr:hypothetical protein [Hydrocarboniphaga sp.]MDB5970210.1 hypothetical protein [Hydrocarboniphaga sp.]